jgi:hypothetical protein
MAVTFWNISYHFPFGRLIIMSIEFFARASA